MASNRIVAIAVLFLVFFASSVQANKADASLRARIAQSLEAAISNEIAVEGIENCENKCEKAYNRFAYAISATDGRRTYEFRACVLGCNRCGQQLQNLTAASDPADCFKFCKNTPWKTDGMLKGVIEPDKACLGGCIINTCQVICTGGTTEDKITPQNKRWFYPNGGCSLKTEPYSQNLEYVPFNSPNTGQGGSEDAAQCCANAFSLCDYVGDRNTVNFQQVLVVSNSACAEFVPSGGESAICEWFRNPANCGGVLPPA